MNKSYFFLFFGLFVVIFTPFVSADLPYWQENSTHIWVKVNMSANEEFNLDITTTGGYAEDPENTFLWFDNASSNRLSEYSISVGSKPSHNTDHYRFTGASTNIIYPTGITGENVSMRADIRSSHDTNNQANFYARETGTNSDYVKGTLLWRESAIGTDRISASSPTDGGISSTDLDVALNTYYKFEIFTEGTTFESALDDSKDGQNNFTSPTTSNYLGLGTYAFGGNIDYKNIIFRHYTFNEPSVSVVELGGGSFTASVTNNENRELNEYSVLIAANISGNVAITKSSAIPYSKVQVSDLYDNSTLSGLNVTWTAQGVTNTTDGSGIATCNNCTGDLSFTVNGGSLYFNGSGTGTENATVNNQIYGALVTINATDLLNNSVNTFNVTSGDQTNTTSTGSLKLYLAPNTTNTVYINGSGYVNNYEYTINTTAQDTGSYTITGLYTTELNVTASEIGTGAAINEFTINYTGVTNGSTSTTTGSALIRLLEGNYTLTFDSTNYTIEYANITAENATQSYEFTAYYTNTINISFYDEETGALINFTTVYLEIISDSQSANYSTNNGTITDSFLNPDAYTLRYNALGYEDSFYYFTLADRTFNALNLTLLNTSASTDVTINVFDTLGNRLEGAFVKVLKYDITTNNYNIVEILQTNFEGVTEANIVLNNEYYKFIIDYNGQTRLTTNPTYIYGNELSFYVPIGSQGMEDFFEEAAISGQITYNNNTGLVTFTYSDLDNTATKGCLYSYTRTNGINTLVNTSCSSTSSGTLYSYATNSSNNWFFSGEVTKGGVENVISTFNARFDRILEESGSGALYAFLLLATLVFVALFSLEVAVVLAGIVPFLFTLTGLANFNYYVTVPILALSLVTAFILGSNKK